MVSTYLKGVIYLTVILQHSPMSIRASVNVEIGQKTMVVVTRKRLGEKVCHISGRWDLLNQYSSRLYELSDIVVPDVDVLYLSMVLRILRQRNCPSAVSLYHPWHDVVNHDFIKPILHPHHLLSATRHGNIFSLNG